MCDCQILYILAKSLEQEQENGRAMTLQKVWQKQFSRRRFSSQHFRRPKKRQIES